MKKNKMARACST